MRLDETRREEQTENSEPVDRIEGMKSRGRSLEVTGLGMIAALMIAFWSLVSDGTIRLSEYLIFVSFLLVSAGGLIWRIWQIAPQERKAIADRLQPGAYRVSFARQERPNRRRPRL